MKPEYRNNGHVAGFYVVVILTMFILVNSVIGQPAIGSNGFGNEPVYLDQIRRAISEKGLHWEVQDYGREFSLGAIIIEEDEDNDIAAPVWNTLDIMSTSLDWRNNSGNYVSPVRDQGQCGSCWAFAAVGALESLICISQNTPGQFLDLSEQILVSCCTGNLGCSGGYMNVTAQFMLVEGTDLETCFPYTATNNSCSNACYGWRDRAYKISSYSAVSRDVNALKTALQAGPLQVAFYVYSDFRNYSSGVYEYAYGSLEGGHAVLLVGYQDIPGQYGGGYFIVKNSWGSSWGELGYFRIGYSQVSGTVGFGRNSYLYIYSSDPVPTPPPSIPLCEALDNCALAWTTGGNGNWFGQASVSYDGVDAAQSGAITHNQSTWLDTEVDGPGDLSFWWKVSSESNYDYLEFYLDGVRQDRISGSVNWQRKTYNVGAGRHTLRWRYMKDGSVNGGSDCGWVDQVVWSGGVQPIASRWIYDYNGDGTSDIAIFRPASGLWAIRGITRAYFGTSNVIPVPGDYTGDGTTDIGIFRESSGLWAVRGKTRVYFGSTGDIPLPGDYNGNGTTDIGLFRPTSGLWAIRQVTRMYFGSSADVPIPGYYDGTSASPAIFRPASGLWAIKGITRTYFGSSSDEPVPGDYDGDGSWDLGIFRSTSGLWAVQGVTRAYFGGSSDSPIPGGYKGDGRDYPGIFRETSGLWAIKGVTRTYFGTGSDVPVTR